MGIDAETAIYNLMQGDPNIIAVTVLKGKEIIYQTDNWDISSDVGRVVSSWVGQNAQFVMISGVKYSMLQCEKERMVATSIRGEGHIVAAKDDEHKIICYLEPDGDARGAIMDVQRAVGSMSNKEAYLADDEELGSGGGGHVTPAGGASVDPQLKGEIQAFLEWIKDSDGLAGYINYYLQQNDAQKISELSQIYTNLREIFGV